MPLENSFDALALDTSVQDVVTAVNALNFDSSGMEALQTAGNATLVAIDNNTNNVEGHLLSILAAVADLDPNTDGLEALLTSVAAALAGTLTVQGTVEVTNDVGNPLPVSGTVTITDGAGPVTVDGTVNIGTAPEIEVKNDAGAPLTVTHGTAPAAATVTQVLVNNTVDQLLAANANRQMATFYNTGSQDIFLKLGAGATNTSFTARVVSGGYYELPLTKTGVYTGIVTAIGNLAANATVYVTEM